MNAWKKKKTGLALFQRETHVQNKAKTRTLAPSIVRSRLSLTPARRQSLYHDDPEHGNMAMCLCLHKALQFSLCPPAEPGHLSCCVCCRHVWISPAASMPAAMPSCPQHPLWYTIDLSYFHGAQCVLGTFFITYCFAVGLPLHVRPFVYGL